MKISDIKQQAKNQQRFSVFVDGSYSFSLSESQLIDTGIHAGMELDATKLKELKQQSDFGKVLDKTFNLLSYRPRSEWEIQTYLAKHKQPAEVSQRIIKLLRDKGYIDDGRFAERWVESKRRIKAISTKKLRQQLLQKRIDKSIIDEVLRDESDNDALAAVIAKKRHRYTDQQKFMRYLAGQGFRYDDIKQALTDND